MPYLGRAHKDSGDSHTQESRADLTSSSSGQQHTVSDPRPPHRTSSVGRALYWGRSGNKGHRTWESNSPCQHNL